MATTTTTTTTTSLFLSNFLSFLSLSNPPPKKLFLSSPPPQIFPQKLNLHHDNNSKNKLVPLVAQEGNFGGLPSELSAVTYPSVANVNTLYFKSAYNVQVLVDENEPEERLLNRFRREVIRAGVIQECKRRRFFENKQDEKKRKSREAAKRNRRRRPMSRSGPPSRREVPTAKKDVEDEDNWELPEGDLPY